MITLSLRTRILIGSKFALLGPFPACNIIFETLIFCENTRFGDDITVKIMRLLCISGVSLFSRFFSLLPVVPSFGSSI